MAITVDGKLAEVNIEMMSVTISNSSKCHKIFVQRYKHKIGVKNMYKGIKESQMQQQNLSV